MPLTVFALGFKALYVTWLWVYSWEQGGGGMGAIPFAPNLVSPAAATWPPCSPWGQEWTTLARRPCRDPGVH